MRSSIRIRLWASVAVAALCLNTSCTPTPPTPKTDAAAPSKPLQFNRDGKRHYHDEPIIIDNGPIVMCFNPLLDPESQGHPVGDQHFSRQPAAKITKAIVWKCKTEADCGQPTSYAVYGTSATVLSTGKPIDIFWDPVNEEDKGALLAQSLNQSLVETSDQVVELRDRNVRIIGFQYQNSKGKKDTVNLAHDRTERVRIQLCTPDGKCPEYATLKDGPKCASQ